MRIIFTLLALLMAATASFAQIQTPVTWSFSFEQIDDQTIDVYAVAEIEDGWKVYGTEKVEGGPVNTSITLQESLEGEGRLEEVTESSHGYDEVFALDITYFKHKAKLKQRIKVPSGETIVSGYITFMTCDDKQCLAPEDVDFAYDMASKKAIDPSTLNTSTETGTGDNLPLWHTNPKETSITFYSAEEDVTGKSLWGIFFAAFLGGIVALLTPCVFPMIPFTVSFFTKQGGSRSDGIKRSILYGIFIVAIYVLLGTLVVVFFGPDSLNALSTNYYFNMFFFVLLIVFAASFMGAFDLSLPSSWLNASDKQVDKGGILGIFFMALTLALVSFSCTGPIVGALIAVAASTGEFTGPAIGMLGFSLAIAIPFMLFAAFPSWLNSIPKSGGWMNSVKVYLAFIEIALSLKFLSIADLVEKQGILERELFIALWASVALISAIYLFGLIRFPHDSTVRKPSWFSKLLGVVMLSLSVYFATKVWGGRMTIFSGFPPPSSYSESPFGLSSSDLMLTTLAWGMVILIMGSLLFLTLYKLRIVGSKANREKPSTVLGGFVGIVALGLFMYMLPVFSGAPIRLVSWGIPGFEVVRAEKPPLPAHMHYGPQGIPAFDDYEEALKYAKKEDKPLLVDFTGYGCVNCRDVEEKVWSDAGVSAIISEDYVLVSLYVDAKEELPEELKYTSPASGKRIRSYGNLWSDFQFTRFQANAQPYYVFMSPNREVFGTVLTHETDIQIYTDWLNSGKEGYREITK